MLWSINLRLNWRWIWTKWTGQNQLCSATCSFHHLQCQKYEVWYKQVVGWQLSSEVMWQEVWSSLRAGLESGLCWRMTAASHSLWAGITAGVMTRWETDREDWWSALTRCDCKEPPPPPPLPPPLPWHTNRTRTTGGLTQFCLTTSSLIFSCFSH